MEVSKVLKRSNCLLITNAIITIISKEFNNDILDYEKKYNLKLIQKNIEDIDILDEFSEFIYDFCHHK